jgi:hypothetical protein
MQTPNTYRGGPDARGHFGLYGGRFVAETLMPLILQVEAAYNAAKDDPNFHAELGYYLEHYVGRPSPLYFAERLTRHFGGAKLYFKRGAWASDASSPRRARGSTALPLRRLAPSSTFPVSSIWATPTSSASARTSSA